jgi:hypothetical protein
MLVSHCPLVERTELMSKHVISSQEAMLLFSRLVSERISVTAQFSSAGGTRVILAGFVDSTSALNGVVISPTRPPSTKDGFMMVPFDGRTFEFSYCDRRELPAGFEKLAAQVGDTVLLVRFMNPVETFGLIFTL